MAVRGRYTVPRIRHRATPGAGITYKDLGIVSPRTRIFADSIFAGSLDSNLIKVGTLNAGLIKKGTLESVRIPNISANLITTGTLNAALIKTGTLNAGLIKKGTLESVRIPNISANLITTGTLNAALIKTGTLNAARIGAGTILTGDIIIGSPTRIRISPTNKYIRVYDSVGSLRVEFGSLI